MAKNGKVEKRAFLIIEYRGKIFLLLKIKDGLWTLPGGHVGKGETAKDAAIRETKEEARRWFTPFFIWRCIKITQGKCLQDFRLRRRKYVKLDQW